MQEGNLVGQGERKRRKNILGPQMEVVVSDPGVLEA